ncbi:MAG: hypothetical protein WKG32_17655, partial [Gemmatimonadaceae bacterium]
MDEKRARATGRVEHGEPFGTPAQRDRLAGVERLASQGSLHGGVWECGRCERMGERGARHARDDRLRSVEGAARAAVARGHQRLERLPEHLGIDRRLRPCRGILARGEAVAREQVAEHEAECLVREDERALSPLERGAREESSIQKRYATERACSLGAPGTGRVEGAEEERAEHARVVAAAGGETRVEAALEEAAVAIEPALRLEEGEKEQPRYVEESQLAPLGIRRLTAREARHFADHAFQGAVEAAGQRLAAKHLEPACVHEHVVAARRCGERAQRLRITRHDVAAVYHERGDARPRRGSGPRGEHELGRAALHRQHDPEQVRCAGAEPRRECAHLLARLRAGWQLYQERAQRADPSAHERRRGRRGAPGVALAGGVETERRAGGGVEWERRAIAPDRGGDGGEGGGRGRRGEERGGMVDREHA